jgi:hypothetical protein
MPPRREYTVKGRIERPRTHKGFVLKRGTDEFITIIDANGNPLSETMKFLEHETASAFLDRWVARKEGGRGLSGQAAKASNRPVRRKRRT